MPLTLTSFPQIPPARSALTSADTARYITGPAASNFSAIETLVDSLETTVNAIPPTTRSGTMPTSAVLYQRWVDSSSNDQEKLCILAYTAGNGTTANWIALRDATATSLVKVIANSQSPDSGHLTTLKNDIISYASDLSLSTDERAILSTLQAELTTRNTEIVQAAASFSLTGNAAYTAYGLAYTAWLNLGPLPANPIPNNFATLWNDLLDKEATILATIRTTANTLLSTLNGNVTSIQNTVDDMANDNKITAAEKIPLKQEYDRIVDEKTKLTSLATTLGHTAATQYTTYVAAYDALVTLVTVTHVVFGANIGVTTTLTDGEVTTWNTTWQAYYASARAFDSYVDTQFKSNLDTFSSTLSTYGTTISNISDDTVISGGSEKYTLQREWTNVQRAKTGLEARAALYSVAIPSAFTTAFTNLSTYIVTTTAMFSDLETNTTGVNHSSLNSLFDTFRTEYQNFETAIQAAIDATLISFTSTISAITDDNQIDSAERSSIRLEWKQIQDRQASIVATAATYSVSTVTLVNTYNALNTYLNTTLDLFNATLPLTVVRATFTTTFTNWYDAYKTALDAVETARKGSLDSATAAISSLTADGTVNGGSEKRLLKNIWDDIVSKNVVLTGYAGTFSVAVPANYTNAYNALDTYLNSTLGIFTSMTVDTNVDRGQMEALFNAYRTQYDLLSASVATAQSTAITTAVPTGYANFTALIESMVDDNVIAAGAEKVWFNAIWADITATHATFIATATNSGVGTTGLTNAYNALNTYLNTTLSQFTIINVDTNANHQIILGLFRDYETQKAILNQDIIAAALVAVRDGAAAVADMNNDGVITPIEKASVQRLWTRYGIERNNAVTQANALSITTERDTMTTAYSTLETYLGASDVNLFASMTTSTTLTTLQNNNWDTYWFSYETAYMALMTAIQSAQITNNLNITTDAFRRDGTSTVTGDFEMSSFKITQLGDAALSNTSTDAVNGKLLWTEQQARIAGDAAATAAIAPAVTAHDITTGVHGVGAGFVVGTTLTQTLTNKTIDVDNNTVSNIETDNFKSGVIVTTVGATGTDTAIPTEQAVREGLAAVVSDAVYGAGWNGETAIAPSKNAVYDKVNAMVSDDAYAAGWNGVTDVAPSKNAVYDKIELLNTLITAAGNDFLCYGENTTVQANQAIIGTGIDTSSGDYAASSFHLRMYMVWNQGIDVEATIKKRPNGNVIAIIRTQRPYDADTTAFFNAGAYYAISTNFADADELVPQYSPDGTTDDDVKLVRDDTSNELCFKFVTSSGVRESKSLTVLEGQLQYTGSVISPGQGTKL